MTKLYRDSSSLSQGQSSSARTGLKSTSQRPSTKIKEIRRAVGGARENNEMGRDQDAAQNAIGKTELSEEDANYNEPDQLEGCPTESPEAHRFPQSYYQQYPHNNHHHHNQKHQLAQSYSASKVTNADESPSEAHAHLYRDQPQCHHTDRPRPKRLHHKPTCVLHNSQMSPTGCRRMFKSLINQPHVQLSSSTSSLRAALAHQHANDGKRTVGLQQISQHRNRHIKHLTRPADDKTKHLLLAENHHQQRPPRAAGLMYANNSHENRDFVYADERMNLRNSTLR